MADRYERIRAALSDDWARVLRLADDAAESVICTEGHQTDGRQWALYPEQIAADPYLGDAIAHLEWRGLAEVEHSDDAIRLRLHYPECSGDPKSCPENEGYGCCKANHPEAQQPAAESQGGGEVVERAMEYLRPHLEAGTFAAPDWAIQLASILTGGDGCGAPAPPSAHVGVEGHYHPCTSILIEGLKRLEGGGDVLAEWDRARAKADAALATQQQGGRDDG